MAAQDLIPISARLQALDLDGDISERTENMGRPQLVDTLEAVKTLVDTLVSLKAASAPLYVDLEGVNLSRHGSISIIQIWLPLLQQAFLVDIHVLGTTAFDTTNSEGKTLRTILGSERIKKYFFDVRNDADALYALFNVRLAGVVDVQLLELASRRGPKHVVCGLAACIEHEHALPSSKLHDWQTTKTEVVKMFDPKLGGSYEVFNIRPLPQILIDYCVGDVKVLPTLSAIYDGRLNYHWSEKARTETEKRLEESRGPSYKHKGKHKIFGPKDWRFPSKSKPSPTVSGVAPATYSLSALSSVHNPVQTEV
ncbi:hypothetical protein LTR17_008826 [Elasticomyces elasticus]|nr:hypothetical protein LTR17_008826 [Elasticomyces elasticus]